MTQTLPRGRHGLSRAFVENDQRERVMAAIVDEVAQHGLAGVTIAAIVARAHVSRQTFYALFGSKEQCYAQAFDHIGASVVAAAAVRLDDAARSPLERLEVALTDYFATLAANPEVTRCLLLERPVHAAQMEARMQERGTAALVLAFGAEDRFAAVAYGSMVRQFVTDYVTTGRTSELPDLIPSILTFAKRYLDGRDGVTEGGTR